MKKADYGILKKAKNRFGDEPPSRADVTENLKAPEVAPADPQQVQDTPKKKSRRKTGRTVQFSTRVTAEFNEEFREIAFRNRLKKAELLERCLEAFKKV